jgi:hypothetical protein
MTTHTEIREPPARDRSWVRALRRGSKGGIGTVRLMCLIFPGFIHRLPS